MQRKLYSSELERRDLFNTIQAEKNRSSDPKEKFAFLKRLIEVGDLSANLLPNILSIEALLEELYPDLHDIVLDCSYMISDTSLETNIAGFSYTSCISEIYFKISFIIKYPEITISNTNGKSHLIKDLYVRAYVEGDSYNFTVHEIEGARTTLTYIEARSNYVHSHIHTEIKDAHIYHKFCTGTGEITQIQSRLKLDSVKAMFKMYFLQLNMFVTHESIEGIPYHYISSIGKLEKELLHMGDSACEDEFRRIFRKRKEEGFIIDLGWKIQGEKVIISNIANLTAFLKYSDNAGRYHEFVPTIHTEEGVYYSLHNAPKVPPNTAGKFLTFKGEQIPFIIEESLTEVEEMPTDFTIHPALVEYTKNQLEKQANEKRTRLSYARLLT
jgi:hypothetical protein